MADWKLRRGDSEWPIESIAMLQEWARSGRVSTSDYVFNPILEKWMYAEDLKELEAVLTNTGNSRNTSHPILSTTGGAVTPKASSAKKPGWQHKIAIGITMIIIGVALITISPRLVSQRAYSYSYGYGPTMTDFRTDTSGKDLAFFGGIVLLIVGGVLSAVGVSESTKSR